MQPFTEAVGIQDRAAIVPPQGPRTAICGGLLA
jgi:hypothetical protein